jgi:hypothetical protein
MRKTVHVGPHLGKLVQLRSLGMGPQAPRQRDIEGGAVNPAKAVSLPVLRLGVQRTPPPAQAGTEGLPGPLSPFSLWGKASVKLGKGSISSSVLRKVPP